MGIRVCMICRCYVCQIPRRVKHCRCLTSPHLACSVLRLEFRMRATRELNTLAVRKVSRAVNFPLLSPLHIPFSPPSSIGSAQFFFPLLTVTSLAKVFNRIVPLFPAASQCSCSASSFSFAGPSSQVAHSCVCLCVCVGIVLIILSRIWSIKHQLCRRAPLTHPSFSLAHSLALSLPPSCPNSRNAIETLILTATSHSLLRLRIHVSRSTGPLPILPIDPYRYAFVLLSDHNFTLPTHTLPKGRTPKGDLSPSARLFSPQRPPVPPLPQLQNPPTDHQPPPTTSTITATNSTYLYKVQ